SDVSHGQGHPRRRHRNRRTRRVVNRDRARAPAWPHAPLRDHRCRGGVMTRRHQLESTLRTLKLSGMLDTLEARLAQARAGELGHLEFLQVLCEDEINRRGATALARRVRAARFNEVTTLEGFDFSYNPKVPAATIRDL